MMEHVTRAKPLTVSGLTQAVKGVLEEGFPRLWLVGEIANFKRAGSGHWYFSLKDEQSQVRCNLWRSYASRVGFDPRDGAEVLVYGGLNVYPPRGEYSLIVEHMEPLGQGRMRQAFERLKRRLEEEGLFDPADKQVLPLLPRRIGVVTSPTGAALRDILRVLQQRYAGVSVRIFPARVQGDGAASEIALGVKWLDMYGQCDVIIVGRGGGSEEDLWAFNEEVLARTLYEANTPIISAVGHEVDFTIADFVADVRAATPSNAAELAVRSDAEYRGMIELQRKNLMRAVERKIMTLSNRVRLSERHPIFVRVRSRFHDQQRVLADLEQRARTRMLTLINRRRMRLARADERLRPQHLITRLSRLQDRLLRAQTDLEKHAVRQVSDAAGRTTQLIGRLEDLSPLKILSRGYAAVFDESNRIVRSPSALAAGDPIRVRLAEGELRARVLAEDESGS